ncbi:MAG: insertion sequence Is21 ATP-binding protein [Candidatus Magnetoglobus multicellularis str. Araruama]|uniref:Insertion sequence Is21 ATP-binding protein n=1 Tax=Candidatus Magnetoglobus multicellularis str. Araruama TaxID=890399 RepID=A0A1V1NXB3_9BACT|nr:MAG: insertion sequence Is21 ATP-binding protein [Candidatus Magnetoglobus multicellularis str. Araruama]
MEKIPDKTRMKVIAHLETLRLRKIRDILDEELGNAVKNKSTALELLERLLSIEANSLIDRRIERRIKESKLPERKLLADFDFDFQKSIDKQQIMELSTLNFIERKQGLILAGNSGTGKSYIAKALILCACQRLYRSRYTTASDMLKELMSGLSDESLEQKLKKYISPEVLLIDEIGFDRLEQESSRNASLFFKVIDGRYCKSSTIITSNIDFKDLGDYLGDPVITTAIVDRMIHHSIIINIEGPSYRMHESKKLNGLKS